MTKYMAFFKNKCNSNKIKKYRLFKYFTKL